MAKNQFGFPTGKIDLGFNSQKARRTPVTKKASKIKQLRVDQNGKCWMCHKPFNMKKVTPWELHHKNGNHSDHRMSNLALICTDCHDKKTLKQTLHRKGSKRSNPYGLIVPKKLKFRI